MSDTSYLSIKEEINSLKATYPWLRNKADERVFSLLSIKSNFFKNPALNKNVDDINEMIVDGTKDGGVDALFWILIQMQMTWCLFSLNSMRQSLRKTLRTL